MNVAIVHDWLETYAGSERVLEQMVQLYPDADLFSLVDVLPKGERGFIQNKPVHTSFIQRLPFAERKFRSYLPLMPLAVEQFDLSNYDLVLSSSHAVAKGVITGPDQLHISYVHSPMRYAWDLQFQYLKEADLEKGAKSWATRYLLHRLRRWDAQTANGVDYFVANSHFIARRIWKTYRREAEVIYPPVDTESFTLHTKKEDFYVTASRQVPNKRIDLIVEAFSQMPDKRLVVIGDGPEAPKIRSKAAANVTLMGYQPLNVLKDHMQRAKAFVFASVEDLGIVPIEAQACGTPVIAYGKGGVLETVKGLEHDTPTGVFFPEQTLDSLIQAVALLERSQARFNAAAIRQHAQTFREEHFRATFQSYVTRCWAGFQNRSQQPALRSARG